MAMLDPDTADQEATDAARYRWLRASHLQSGQFVLRVGERTADNGYGPGTLWRGVNSEAEYDLAVDSQMSGVKPMTVRLG